MKGKKVEKTVREALLKAIDESSASNKRCCDVLFMNERRYYRWKRWKEPKKRVAWNKIRPEEEAEILETARTEEQADLRRQSVYTQLLSHLLTKLKNNSGTHKNLKCRLFH